MLMISFCSEIIPITIPHFVIRLKRYVRARVYKICHMSSYISFDLYNLFWFWYVIIHKYYLILFHNKQEEDE